MSDFDVNIRYEELSAEIQKVISDYHKSTSQSASTLDDATRNWFENEFEGWLHSRFAKGDNARKAYRLDVELPVHIAEVLVESHDDAEAEVGFGGTTINISRGGLFFKSKKPIDSSSILKVIVDMSAVDPEFPRIEAMAMVMRCSRLGDDSYGIGLMFSSIYQEDRETLNLFIFKNLTYYLSHE
jgi:hypothetical protein